MTTAELAILLTAIGTFVTAVANLTNSISNRGKLREIAKNTDGMTERLESAARLSGAAEEANDPSPTPTKKAK